MEYLLLKFAHVIAFVYWLGGDLGTYVASNYTVRRDISPESRGVALKIMLACDQGPKIAMPLMLALGIHMASISGVMAVPVAALVVVWLLAAVWLSNVMILHTSDNAAMKAKLSAFDLWFRIVVAALIAAYAIAGLAGAAPVHVDWLAWKLLIFAALVGCGIMIRINLKPFVPAFGTLLTQGASDVVNDTLEKSLAACRPWVYLIWVGLFASAALGLHLIG